MVWDQLMNMAQSLNNEDEWIVMGDFNQIIFNKDKLAFNNSKLRGVDALLKCLDQYALSEIPPKSQYLTWTNNRHGNEVIWERLDRCFANFSWFRNLEDAPLINLHVSQSNHRAMILNIKRIYLFISDHTDLKQCG